MEGQKFSLNLTRAYLFTIAQFVKAQYVSRRILDRDKRNILFVQPRDPSAQVRSAEPAEHFHIVVWDRVRHLVSLLVSHCFGRELNIDNLVGRGKVATNLQLTTLAQNRPKFHLLPLTPSCWHLSNPHVRRHTAALRSIMHYALCTMRTPHVWRHPAATPWLASSMQALPPPPHAFLVLSRAPLLSLDCRDRGDANDPDYDSEARHQDKKHSGCPKNMHFLNCCFAKPGLSACGLNSESAFFGTSYNL